MGIAKAKQQEYDDLTRKAKRQTAEPLVKQSDCGEFAGEGSGFHWKLQRV